MTRDERFALRLEYLVDKVVAAIAKHHGLEPDEVNGDCIHASAWSVVERLREELEA